MAKCVHSIKTSDRNEVSINIFKHPGKKFRRQKSSNINDGTTVVLFFKRNDFTCTKSTKSIKSTKSTKRKQTTFTQTFFMRIKNIKSIKSTKSTKCQTSDFLPLRCFYAHKNVVFFMHIKSIKTYISE